MPFWFSSCRFPPLLLNFGECGQAHFMSATRVSCIILRRLCGGVLACAPILALRSSVRSTSEMVSLFLGGRWVVEVLTLAGTALICITCYPTHIGMLVYFNFSLVVPCGMGLSGVKTPVG